MAICLRIIAILSHTSVSRVIHLGPALTDLSKPTPSAFRVVWASCYRIRLWLLPPDNRWRLPPLNGYCHRIGRIFFLDEVRELSRQTLRRKINDRVVPILVAIRNWNDVIWLSRSEKVAEFAQCVAPCRLKLSRLCQITHRK